MKIKFDKEKSAEALSGLVQSTVDFSGIQFIPAVTCDALYYVDSFN